MARDYAKKTYKKKSTKKGATKKPVRASKKQAVKRGKGKSKAKKTQKKAFPRKRLIALLILICIIVIVLLLLIYVPHRSSSKPNATPVEYVNGEKPSVAKLESTKANSQKIVNHELEFKFERSVIAGNQAVSYYMLQFGRFSASSPALPILKSKLKALGQRFHVVKLLRDDKVSYRIEAGPYYKRSSVQKVWQDLYQQKVYAVIRQVIAPIYQSPLKKRNLLN